MVQVQLHRCYRPRYPLATGVRTRIGMKISLISNASLLEMSDLTSTNSLLIYPKANSGRIHKITRSACVFVQFPLDSFKEPPIAFMDMVASDKEKGLNVTVWGVYEARYFCDLWLIFG